MYNTLHTYRSVGIDVSTICHYIQQHSTILLWWYILLLGETLLETSFKTSPSLICSAWGEECTAGPDPDSTTTLEPLLEKALVYFPHIFADFLVPHKCTICAEEEESLTEDTRTNAYMHTAYMYMEYVDMHTYT